MKKPTNPLGAEAEATSALFKALASLRRLMIACRLVGGEETVGARREGQLVRYALRSQAARDIIQVLSKSLSGFEAAQSLRS